MKRILTGIALMILVAGCAVAKPARVYRIGDIEVRIFPSREELFRDMPIDVQIAIKVQHLGVFGWHRRIGDKSTIWTLDDIDSFVHELKHYLEPDWKHPVPCGPDLCLKEFK